MLITLGVSISGDENLGRDDQQTTREDRKFSGLSSGIELGSSAQSRMTAQQRS